MSANPEPAGITTTIPVELGKIGELVRAIGDDNPLHRSLAAARHSGFDQVPAPLTFSTVVPHSRPDELQGLGAIIAAIGAASPHADPSLLLGESRWEYQRHPVVGDLLTGRTQVHSIRNLARRDGSTMRSITVRTTWVDADGMPTMDEDQVILEMPAQTQRAGNPAAETEQPGPAPCQSSSQPCRLFGPLTRVDIARYAGATGGFARIHLDEPYAQSHGLPSVFSTGPLHAGQLAAVVTQSFPLRSVASLRVRYVARVWPGDVLGVTAPEPVSTPGFVGDQSEYQLQARNQHGDVCVQGWVTIR